ncbi:aspartate carbamoyltransferase catalytic subunit [Sagittula salina]|uniref:Aspartate carbamoyltransferase catalytic subunit n=1 Tax=Sagittula salina TaxID=2820268 RepID=A0A940MPP0_9RHOB|nr:aspartate carbamoyltransferase catalytic subunit [Sagittula salina]MBP0482647.1 aspartate carbamoyltransferase catalytic subunit [Sagittula salina]
MTQVQINGSDTSTVHLLHLDLPPRAIERFTAMAGTGEWPLKYGLGAAKLSPAFVETIDLRDLGAMTLSQYLAEAYDLPPKALAADKARVDALQGHVVVLPPQAFENTSQQLNVNTPLSYIGGWSAATGKSRSANLRARSAAGQGAGGPPSAMGNLSKPILIAIIALVAVAGAVLALVL